MRKLVILLVVVAIIVSGRVSASAAVIGAEEDSIINPGRIAHEIFKSRCEYSLADVELMAAAMELENGMNSDLCLLYTGSVILNRVNDSWYPNTIEGVLTQKGQYAERTVSRLYKTRASDRVFALAMYLAANGSLDREIIFQSMYPHLGHVKYIVDGEYFATE